MTETCDHERCFRATLTTKAGELTTTVEVHVHADEGESMVDVIDSAMQALRVHPQVAAQ